MNTTTTYFDDPAEDTVLLEELSQTRPALEPGGGIAASMVPAEMTGRAVVKMPIETLGELPPAPSVSHRPAMLPEEISGAESLEKGSPHETPGGVKSVSQSVRYLERLALWQSYEELLAARPGLSQVEAARLLSVSNVKLSRMAKAVAEHGIDGLKDNYHNCGRKPKLTFTADELLRLQALYLKTNRAEDAGSMQTACKFFALDPSTREEIRTAILSALELGRLPRFCTSALKRITREHFAAYRNPSKLGPDHFSGRRGSFAREKMDRLRIIESDDATINFPAWIPWPQGGDPVSDKFGVKLGRWQFLPALDAGWTHYFLGYSLVARPRGSYTQDDVRAVISMVVKQYGLPDGFRFEQGTWKSNSIVDLLQKLGIDLNTVWQSNQKPFIEGSFNKLWTYLSVIDGQVGRFRGEMEETNLLVEKCRAGRADPRDHFPSLTDCTRAIDGALAMHNSDTIRSHYGTWVPEVRHKLLAEQRPWRQLPADMAYLFAPLVREWTVAKGTVGNDVTLSDGLKVPFYFAHDDLWRMNGQKVRVYFDPTAEQVTATIVALAQHAGYKTGELICQAKLFGEIPHFARAAMGWADPASSSPSQPSHRGPLSQVRREVRALAPNGRVKAATSEEQDGRGRMFHVERSGSAVTARQRTIGAPQPETPVLQRTVLSREPNRARPGQAEAVEIETISARRMDAAQAGEIERIVI